MNYLNKIIALCVFLVFSKSYGQLSFCNGNSGSPIFTETFGTGTTSSALPAGTTTYTFSSSAPSDGFYTVSNTTNWFDWHQITDHTPNDTNGKMLVVNADYTAGEFYRTTINGLCENTSYEFSSWMVNLSPSNGSCGSGVIPINVTFQIWDNTDTNLLASGSTGNIYGSSSANWQQFALVFKTLSAQNAVILKMLNNGSGGCGNDLAKSCGDFIAVNDSSNSGSNSICSTQTPYNITLNALPDGAVFNSHFYQWQQSNDGNTWVDISGETSSSITISGITSSTFFRTKVAESSVNVNNSLCNVLSETYNLHINQLPSMPSLNCWETATLNPSTCGWDITGIQPSVPANIECWEMATFNNSTCSWDISGMQPPAPTNLKCWETTSFNNTTCSWDITGVQPSVPANIECWETATFNNSTCSWDISGKKPIESFEETALFCPNESVLLTPTTTINNPSYLWNTGEKTTQIRVSTVGDYTVEITDGCITHITTYHVDDVEIPIIETITSQGSNIIITTKINDAFLYSIDGIHFQNSSVFKNIDGGLYTVYVKDRNNCNLVSEQQFLHFFVPKYFTPNNDGIHDTWDLKGIEYYSQSEVLIFNRYGKLLKSSKNSPFSWGGTFKNEKLPTNDYWYIIIIDGHKITGHVTLKP